MVSPKKELGCKSYAFYPIVNYIDEIYMYFWCIKMGANCMVKLPNAYSLFTNFVGIFLC
jgi:hypothetical protein